MWARQLAFENPCYGLEGGGAVGGSGYGIGIGSGRRTAAAFACNADVARSRTPLAVTNAPALRQNRCVRGHASRNWSEYSSASGSGSNIGRHAGFRPGCRRAQAPPTWAPNHHSKPLPAPIGRNTRGSYQPSTPISDPQHATTACILYVLRPGAAKYRDWWFCAYDCETCDGQWRVENVAVPSYDAQVKDHGWL